MAKPKSFVLRVESTPAGADVVENDRVLGKTPLDVVIERESVVNGSRELSLRLSGYKPHVIKQGVSETDVRVQAELVPEVSTAEAETAAPEPTQRTHSASRQPRQPAPKSSARPTAPPSTDIKLHR
jgi:hypothetical protein